MQIINKTKDTRVSENAVMATSVFSRMKGLLGRASLNKGEALILNPCNSIHTFFMRFAIDVLFVDKQGRIIKACKNIKPYRITPIYLRSSFVIELPVGTIDSSGTSKSDRLALIS